MKKSAHKKQCFKFTSKILINNVFYKKHCPRGHKILVFMPGLCF